MNISIKLVYPYMTIVINCHLLPLQVENCDSNSRLVVDEDDNGKFRFERVKIVLFEEQIKRLQTAVGVTST